MTADVIRWTEPVWLQRGRRRKATRVGSRVVAAEVLAEPDAAWARLSVLRVDVAEDLLSSRAELVIKHGTEIRRRKTTLLRGLVARLSWSDEEARAAVRAGVL